MSCPSLCDSSSVWKVQLNIELNLYKKKKPSVRLCVYMCVACGETAPMGLAATKGYAGGEAQWMGPARELS